MFTELEQNIVDSVEKYGWFGLSLAPRADSDDPNIWFTYTIGLPKSHDWPEIIVLGLPGRTAHNVLFEVITECETKNIRPDAGLRVLETVNGFDGILADASTIPDSYFGSATWYAKLVGTQAPPPRLQLLWPDNAGKFPNEADCEPEVRRMQTPVELPRW